jgi:hypothetical protein
MQKAIVGEDAADRGPRSDPPTRGPEELEEATYLGLLFLANFGGAVVAAIRTQILVDNHDLQSPHAEIDTAIERGWQ